MLIYFIILILSTVLGSLFSKFKDSPILSFVFIIVLFTLLVVFAGVRDWSVGTDTENYRDMFVYKRGELSWAHFVGGLDPAFVVFQSLMQSITTNFVIYLFVIASFVVGLSLKVINKLSLNVGISIFVFISLGTYLFFFNGARQAMAAAVYGFAIIPLLKKKPIQYFVVTIIAILFHKSAVIMLPMYFVVSRSFSLPQFLLMVVFTFFFVNGISIFMSLSPELVTQKLADYHNRTSGGGVILMVVYSIMTTFFYMMRTYIHEKNRNTYDVFLNLSIFTSLVYIMVNVFGQDVNLIRFTLFGSFGFIFIWPYILRESNLFKSIVPWTFFVLSHLIFFYIYINKMIGPYYTNAELF